MPLIGSREPQMHLATEVLRCRVCALVQLSVVPDPRMVFPPDYPYRTGTTRALREHFTALAKSVTATCVLDIGSNDGTLLAAFQEQGAKVWGIEPTGATVEAQQRGIPTDMAFFDNDSAARVPWAPDLITACNVFAHIPDPVAVVHRITGLLAPKGTFLSESHYWESILIDLQYDTVYHEHLRYYSLTSLTHLLGLAGLEVYDVQRIPTHGGSIRVWAARQGDRAVTPAVRTMLAMERMWDTEEMRASLQRRVERSRARLLSHIDTLDVPIWGVGAPSRAATLIQYTGVPLVAVGEVAGSPKIGRCMPGTLIPVVDEAECAGQMALVLSWHIADEVRANLRRRGFRGQFIVPLPEPRLV